ncbi:MAG: choice-of-anchor B family protein [Cryomorphaceae bacterium]|jgi:choice-of-anchor B domain-containing protein|nr:choice-of-anchor B family protein [Cryomorphaceae bacterium]
MKQVVFSLLMAASVVALSQPSNDSLHMRSLLHYPVAQWGIAGAHADCADIWGYADSATGTEYAIIGNRKGTLVVDVTNPSSPSNELWVPGSSSLWRDIKTWSHYAYVVHDVPSGTNPAYNGLLIIDMDSLAQGRWKFLKLPVPRASGQVDTLARAHNLFIDENGMLYAFGSNVGVGGAILVDVATDPWNPVAVGLYDSYYFHDGVARNDTLYGAGLYSGVVMVNVALPSNPQTVTSWATPSNFAHNCWLGDDGNTLYTTDEVANGFITAYDIHDLSNVDEIWRHQIQPGTSIIPHNTHVAGNYLVTSYYTFGVHAMDVEYPELPVLVGYYDTSPFTGGGYYGNWGAYPFLPSGRILASDMEEGLFVLEPEYPEVSRLHVQLGHINWGAGSNVTYGNITSKDFVYFKHSGDTLFADADGIVKFSQAQAMLDTLIYPFEYQLGLGNGQGDDSLFVALGSGQYPHDTLIGSWSWSVSEQPTVPFQVNTADDHWTLVSGDEAFLHVVLNLFSLDGKEIWSDSWMRNRRKSIPFPYSPGLYVLTFRKLDGTEGSVKVYRP